MTLIAGPRRGTQETDRVLNYAAIGATRSDEVVNFPPHGYRPFEATQRLGSGDERFEAAARLLMTWGIHRISGIPVTDVELENGKRAYAGVAYDPAGKPLAPHGPLSDQATASDGTPHVVAGMTATVEYGWGPFRAPAPVKVVYVIDEPDRKGFACGTRHGHPASGEELFLLHRDEDGSVHLTVRSVMRASESKYLVPMTLMRVGERQYAKRILTALHPTRSAGFAA
jgi:uncharacterized protein (UPF0548 family)